jgi:hypothetical protein
MAPEIIACVYCGNRDPADFHTREHVLPQSFGTFGAKTPTLHCVCDGCNSFFMKELDQVLARETLEGITRYKTGRFSRENRVQKELRFSLVDPLQLCVYIVGKLQAEKGSLSQDPFVRLTQGDIQRIMLHREEFEIFIDSATRVN